MTIGTVVSFFESDPVLVAFVNEPELAALKSRGDHTEKLSSEDLATMAGLCARIDENLSRDIKELETYDAKLEMMLEEMDGAGERI